MPSRVELIGGRLDQSSAVKQARYAAALALTQTAKDVEAEGRALMRSTFTRLRPFTLNAQAVRPANKGNLRAEVFFREFAGKGIAAGKYLQPQVHGGARRAKRSEVALRAIGILKPTEFLTPFPGGPFDHNGPGLGGQYTRMLSDFRGNPDQLQNRTARSLKRAKVKGRQPARYFRRADLIFQRQGRTLKPALIIARQPTYSPRFRWDEMAERVSADRMSSNWAQAINQAVRTAR